MALNAFFISSNKSEVSSKKAIYLSLKKYIAKSYNFANLDLFVNYEFLILRRIIVIISILGFFHI